MSPKPVDLTTILLTQRQSLASCGRISLKSTTITSLSKLVPQPKLRVLDVSGTSFKTLESLIEQPALSEIIADGSQLEDFKGLDRHRKLSRFSAVGTPLSRRPHFRIELLIVVGPLLSFINGTPVTTAEREETRPFPQIVKCLLQSGWNFDKQTLSTKEYKDLAKSRSLHFKDKSFEQLSEQEKKELFRLPNLPKPSENVKQEVEKFMEETEKQQKQKEELAEEKLSEELAEQLGRIGINVKPGPTRKEEILSALEGLSEVVKILEEVEEIEEVAEVEGLAEVEEEHLEDELGDK
jgi:hypothetical protein